MNGDPTEKRRRTVVAQGFAALAFFVAVHGAHAAVNHRAAPTPVTPRPTVLQSARR
jgi:hypothetical protein